VLVDLPPELKQQVQSAIGSGVPPQEALQAAMSQAQQQQPQEGQQVPPVIN